MEAVPLSRILSRARRALALNFPAATWVRAELAEVSERRGHRYLLFVEKGDRDRVVARVQGVVWARTYASVLRTRGRAAAEVLAVGQEVVVQADVDYHEVYGLKLAVVDWDPGFTLGQLELRRREIVNELTTRGLLRRNGLLALPPVVHRVAVVTSARAAGYADFVSQLETNPYGYRFATELFDVSVQGDNVEATVTEAIARIGDRADEFDAVAILRGGGSRVDLASFDRLGVGEAIANSPLPVIAGIGHETDETLPDLVAHTSLKTPTALADFIVDRAASFEGGLLRDCGAIARLAERRRAREAETIAGLRSRVALAASRGLQRERQRQLNVSALLQRDTELSLAKRRELLDVSEIRLEALDPAAVLRRGYAFVTRGSKSVRLAADLATGDEIVTHFFDGSIECHVT